MMLGAVPLAAEAARAYALGGTPIFAGPGNDFPVVAQLGSGVAVNVNGCVSDYTWCDVSFGPNRGWAYAGDLAYPYHHNRVPIVEYGPRLSLPIVTFSLGSYWDRHYRGRPFYGERRQWEQRWHEHDHARWDEHRDYNRGRDVGNDHRDARNDYRGDQNRRSERSADQRDHGRDYRGAETVNPHHEPGNEPGMR